MAKKTVTIEAELGEQFKIESDIRGHKVIIDQPTVAGGTDQGPTPLELLFTSLAGCIGSIGRIIAMQKRLPVRGMRITVEGDLDTNGLLGKPIEGRVGFEGITIKVQIDGDLTYDEQNAFLHEVDSRCPVSENLLNATPVSIEIA
ncbi:MAG: OsmC family protein [Pontiellaceae bacterium]|nr:OsmC family protein [Pontiellaceae bacterium]MBN2785717.1 OsmC family protein [Pontiellaceae bacterium]